MSKGGLLLGGWFYNYVSKHLRVGDGLVLVGTAAYPQCTDLAVVHVQL